MFTTLQYTSIDMEHGPSYGWFISWKCWFSMIFIAYSVYQKVSHRSLRLKRTDFRPRLISPPTRLYPSLQSFVPFYQSIHAWLDCFHNTNKQVWHGMKYDSRMVKKSTHENGSVEYSATTTLFMVKSSSTFHFCQSIVYHLISPYLLA